MGRSMYDGPGWNAKPVVSTTLKVLLIDVWRFLLLFEFTCTQYLIKYDLKSLTYLILSDCVNDHEKLSATPKEMDAIKVHE